jgi:hypothetical protein
MLYPKDVLPLESLDPLENAGYFRRVFPTPFSSHLYGRSDPSLSSR